MKKILISLATLIATLGVANSAKAATVFTSELNGEKIVPTPIISPATGSASFSLNDTKTALQYSITLDNLIPETPGGPGTLRAIHFHTGFADQRSPFHVLNILGPLDDKDAVFSVTGNSTTVTGIWDDSDTCSAILTDPCQSDPATSKALTPYLDALLAGGLYINIHTSTHMGGEIRGQITPVPQGPGVGSVTTPEPSSLVGLGIFVLGSVTLGRKHNAKNKRQK